MRTISEISNLFDCSEWQVFELAYVHTFGAASEEEIESAYNTYLTIGDLPGWVTSFLHEYPEEYWEESLSPSPDKLA
jgi:hypothetical protein